MAARVWDSVWRHCRHSSASGGDQVKIRQAVIAVLGFVLLGWTWAFASPTGASPDEAFHLTSIWCVTGAHEGCQLKDSGSIAVVPAAVGTTPCFILNPDTDAACRDSQPTDGLVQNTHFNAATGNYPPLFYLTMRSLVGSDVERSVIRMRMLNVVLGGAVLFAILTLTSGAVRRAVALAWAAGLVPVGLFYVASVNPSSWAIIGGSTFWAFLLTAMSQWNRHRRRAVFAAVAGTITLFMAIFARSDQVWTIGLSVLAVLLLSRQVRWRSWKLWTVLAVSAVMGVVIASLFRLGAYVATLSLTWPTGSQVNDQPNPVVRVLAEFPAYLAGHFGFIPAWIQRSDESNFGTPGWVEEAYVYGLGSYDVALPSLVGVVMVFVWGGLAFIGLAKPGRRKLLALGVLLGGLVFQIMVMRSLGGWGSWENPQGVWWFLHPRYTLPFVLVAAGITLLVRPRSVPLLTRTQAILISVMLPVVSTIALLTTMTRYIAGQDNSWTQLEPSTGWWWAFGPDPVFVAAASFVAAAVFFPTLVSYGRSVQEPMLTQPVSVPT